MAAYATVSDVRTQGITVAQADDATVTDRLNVASEIVDAHTQWLDWGMPGALGTPVTTTVTVNDVRRPSVVLPYPFRSISQVLVNLVAVDPTAYTVEPWGVRLYVSGGIDLGAFPIWALENPTYGTGGRRFGARVDVSATFGWTSVPLRVRHATVLIAAFLLGGKGDMPIDPRIQMLAVEGYQVRFIPHTADEVLDTTGVIEADRLLERFRLETYAMA